MKTYRFAIATSLATFVLLLIGGTVNPTGSSLACPDWPTCYGSFFPEMVGGVVYEHTHRLVATLVGLMTCILAVMIWRTREEKFLRALSLIAVFMVILQGVLGGVTVLLRLPTLVSASHLGLSMIFFLVTIYIAFKLRHPSAQRHTLPPPAFTRSARWLIGSSLLAIYGQILLGALVRHTGAGRVCGTDFPLCAGMLLPPGGPAHLHMQHRLIGVLIMLLIVAAAVAGVRQAKRQGNVFAMRLALAIPHLTLVQIILGIVTITSFVGVAQVTAHLGVAALLLAVVFLLYLELTRHPEVASSFSKKMSAQSRHPERSEGSRHVMPRSFVADAPQDDGRYGLRMTGQATLQLQTLGHLHENTSHS